MKHSKLLSACMSILFCTSIFSQTYFYGPDGREYLSIHTEMISITFAKGVTSNAKAQIVAKEQLLLPYDSLLEIPYPKLSLFQSRYSLQEKDLLALCRRLRAHSEIVDASPIYAYSDGTLQIPCKYVFARLKSSARLRLFKDYATKSSDFHHRSISRDSLLLKLTLRPESSKSTIDLANELHEYGWFDFVEPDFVRLIQPMHTSDPLIAEQWALSNDGENTQLYGGSAQADMNVYTAWNTTTGSSSIKVAIIDEGVDLEHPDLAQNLLPGYDATGQGSLGAANPADAHGTACAGLVAAVGNNSIGIAGVAYNSKVIPIRVAYRAVNNWVTTNGWIANAINWAWEEGQADILSNSWGGGSPSSLINEAIDNALRFGRRGLGSPVVFAAGNHNGELSYPASYSETIAVTAMSMCNERKSLNSCDGENWWGANYGVGVDIAAPGVKISSLDNSGPSGWREGNYLSDFNGTSAACPNVAGVLALILSTAPDLDATEARFVLESTCDKAGTYNYNTFVDGQTAGTWSSELGYGRINAGKALNALACDNCLSCLDGSLNGQEVQIDCGGPDCLPCPSCNDGIRNGDEEDVDCGGSCQDCVCYGQTLHLNIQFDHYPEETSWSIRTPEGVTVASAGPFTEAVGLSSYTEEITLSEGQYVFTIHDSYGDGICCNYGEGSFQLLDASGTTLLAGTEFTAAASVAFCIRANNDTCNDGIQNGEETGVDCGGTCAPCDGLACNPQVIRADDFESGWGEWQGEAHVRRSDLDRLFASSGEWCIRLSGQPTHSGLQSYLLDLSLLSELEIKFAFTASGLEKIKEGFSLHLSDDAGKTFVSVAQWKQERDFDNDKPYIESVQLQGPFSSTSVLRFQVEGSSPKDRVYLDDIFLTGCLTATEPLNTNSALEASKGISHKLNFRQEKDLDQAINLSLFPNPSNGILHFQTKLSTSSQTSLQIFTAQGKIVYQESIGAEGNNSASLPLNLLHLPSGIYWLQISSRNGQIGKKFMIQR
ncbi:MAG: S8 family peptidase [Saprospiraceae bacterium]|nr:S8 family peptidase [Saprospiraceae bacterium]